MGDAKELGKKGESLAASHLAGLGYRILEKNYRTPVGEIDLVASDGDTLVFVEVKSRRGTSFGAPELAVDGRKRKNLARAALVYIARKSMHNSLCRFDVVAVSAGTARSGGAGGLGADPKVVVIKDAFELVGDI